MPRLLLLIVGLLILAIGTFIWMATSRPAPSAQPTTQPPAETELIEMSAPRPEGPPSPDTVNLDFLTTMQMADQALVALHELSTARWSPAPGAPPSVQRARFLFDLIDNAEPGEGAVYQSVPFKNLMTNSRDASAALVADVAAGRDAAALDRRLEAVVASCNACHERYRD